MSCIILISCVSLFFFFIDQLEHALSNKKTLFENVNIDWNLFSAEDASTDFSDDELEERVSSLILSDSLFNFIFVIFHVTSYMLCYFVCVFRFMKYPFLELMP